MGTPRVITDALVPDATRLPGGLTLRPLSIAHILLLQKIDSPLLGTQDHTAAKRAQKVGAHPAKGLRAGLAAVSVVYILTRTDEEVDGYFDGFDRAEFDREVWAFAKRQSPALLVGLEERLEKLFEHAMSTMIGGSDETPGDQKKNDLSELVSEGKDSGLGWITVLIDCIQSEYGWTLNYVLHLHLARVFTFYAAISARFGCSQNGPSYEEAQMLAELAEKKGSQSWAS